MGGLGWGSALGFSLLQVRASAPDDQAAVRYSGEQRLRAMGKTMRIKTVMKILGRDVDLIGADELWVPVCIPLVLLRLLNRNQIGFFVMRAPVDAVQEREPILS
jgi:hypothetical protein